MEEKLISVSKYDATNNKRRELAAKCIEDPYDMEALLKLVHPLAAFVMNKHKNGIPSMEEEDYMQLADIVIELNRKKSKTIKQRSSRSYAERVS